MSEPSQRPGRDPLAVLCIAMLAGGLMLALSGFDNLFERWFGYWRERGVAQFSRGVLDTRLDGLVATMAGILGGSLVGKWLAAWWLAREAPPQAHAWSRRALLASLVHDRAQQA